MSGTNVLRVNSAEEQANYRSAVSDALARVLAEHKVTLVDISERIDVSLGTISNALNKKTDLCATYLLRLALAYGADFLDPYVALCGGRIVPREADENADALPSITASVHSLALARSPNSPGGERITHCELLGMESEIDAAIRALTALKVRCEKVRAA